LYLNVFYLNRIYRTDFLSLFFWFFAFPQFILNACYCMFRFFFRKSAKKGKKINFSGVFVIPFFIILSSAYIRIQQRSVYQKLLNLNQKLLRKSLKPLKKQPLDSKMHYRLFLLTNLRILTISRDQNAYGHFWSDNLSLIFACYIILQCYTAYMFFFLQTNIWFGVLYIAMAFQLTCIEFVLINQCTQVVKWNARLLAQNRAFFYLYQRELLFPISICNLLKVRFLLYNVECTIYTVLKFSKKIDSFSLFTRLNLCTIVAYCIATPFECLATCELRRKLSIWYIESIQN